MPRANLTGTFIKAIDVDKRTDFQDEKQNGLVLRASPGGVMVWTAIYTEPRTKKKNRVTLGRWPDMDTTRARAAAIAALRTVQEGRNPSEEKRERREAPTVQKLSEDFIDIYSKPRKRTWKEDERIFRVVINPAIGNIRVRDLNRADIAKMLERKAKGTAKDGPAPVMADRALALVRKALNWAVARGDIENNPAAKIERHAAIGTRDRVLSDGDFKALADAMPGMHSEAAAVLTLLALTGQRLGEVCGIVASEVDLREKTWTIPSARTKNGLVHIVPLSPAAIAILKDRVDGLRGDAAVFTRGTEPMDKAYIGKLVRGMQSGGDTWTPHDLRRTAATGMAALGVQPHVIEAVLNHISGAKAGVAGIYNRHSYAPEKRAALEQWANHLGTIIPLAV